MDKRLKNRQFGYLTRENNSLRVNMQKQQQIAGYAVGIVYIEDVWYPLVPGNVVNAYSYDFPVRMRAVPNLDIPRIMAADPTIADDIITLGKHMIEKEGVRAISAACGFFGNFQKKVAEALDVPVALSSMVQIPWIKTIIKPSQKIGVLTANGASFNKQLAEACSITDYDQMVVRDLRHAKEFSCILEGRGEFDNGIVREEVIAAALSLLEEDCDIGAILLECSDMPPYAADIQAATQLPVFDFITLIKWLHSGTAQRPYNGWV